MLIMQKVTKEQAEMIEKVVTRFNGDKARAAMNYSPSKALPMDLFVRCMIEGWEIAKPKEQQIKEMYDSYHRQGVSRTIIKRLLKILEIEVDGVTDDKK